MLNSFSGRYSKCPYCSVLIPFIDNHIFWCIMNLYNTDHSYFLLPWDKLISVWKVERLTSSCSKNTAKESKNNGNMLIVTVTDFLKLSIYISIECLPLWPETDISFTENFIKKLNNSSLRSSSKRKQKNLPISFYALS